MKKFFLSAWLATAFAADPVLLPERQIFWLEWEHELQEPGLVFNVYVGTNLHHALSPTNWIVMGQTNGLSTIRAQVKGVLKGTNIFSLTAVSQVMTNSESDHSEPLTIKTLGKPAAPQGLRKP